MTSVINRDGHRLSHAQARGLLDAGQALPPGPHTIAVENGASNITVQIDPAHAPHFLNWTKFKSNLSDVCRQATLNMQPLRKAYDGIRPRYGFPKIPADDLTSIHLEGHALTLQISLQKKLSLAEKTYEMCKERLLKSTYGNRAYIGSNMEKVIQELSHKKVTRRERQKHGKLIKDFRNSIENINQYAQDIDQLSQAQAACIDGTGGVFDKLYPKIAVAAKNTIREGFTASKSLVIYTQPTEKVSFAQWNWSHPQDDNYLVDSRVFGALAETLTSEELRLFGRAYKATTIHDVQEISEMHPHWRYCTGWTGYDAYSPALHPDNCIGVRRVMREFHAFDRETNFDRMNYIRLQDYMDELIINMRAIILQQLDQSETLQGSNLVQSFGQIFQHTRRPARNQKVMSDRIDNFLSPKSMLSQEIANGSEDAKSIAELLDALKIFTPNLIRYMLLQTMETDEASERPLLYVSSKSLKRNKDIDLDGYGLASEHILERDMKCIARTSVLQAALVRYDRQEKNTPWEKVIVDAAAAALCNVKPMAEAELLHKNNHPVTKFTCHPRQVGNRKDSLYFLGNCIP